MTKAIFLDRDGVLNRPIIKDAKPYAPRNVVDFELYKNAIKACKILHSAGFSLFIVTNQPDLKKGLLSVPVLEQMHKICRSHLPITEIAVCPHCDSDRCGCRKPEPGMIIELIEKYSVSRVESYMVGDRMKDLLAGEAASLRCLFIDRGYAETVTKPNVPAFPNLLSAAHHILKET